MLNIFSILFFNEREVIKKKKEKNIHYTLSSVFPSKEIMEEARKYL